MEDLPTIPQLFYPIIYLYQYGLLDGLPRWLSGKESTSNVGDLGLIPGSRRTPGEGNGNPLQYSCLENPMDRGAWRATVHGVTKSWTQLSTSMHRLLDIYFIIWVIINTTLFCCLWYSSFGHWELIQLTPVSLWHTSIVSFFFFFSSLSQSQNGQGSSDSTWARERLSLCSQLKLWYLIPMTWG